MVINQTPLAQSSTPSAPRQPHNHLNPFRLRQSQAHRVSVGELVVDFCDDGIGGDGGVGVKLVVSWGGKKQIRINFGFYRKIL